MKYFIDTEFSERGYGELIELISIGVVDENGNALYRCNSNFDPDPDHVNDWVRENVLSLLPSRLTSYWMPLQSIRNEIFHFISGPSVVDRDVELWGYYCDYDYVILSQLFGGMAGWPQGWPAMMHDLRQWLDHEGLHFVSQPDDAPHDAMADARWIRETYLRFRP